MVTMCCLVFRRDQPHEGNLQIEDGASEQTRMKKPDQLWIYLLADFTGAAVAAGAFNAVNPIAHAKQMHYGRRLHRRHQTWTGKPE